MTFKGDIQKVLAYCEAVKGSYALMAESAQEPEAKQILGPMKTDMERHITFLNDRLEYLNTLGPAG